MGIGGRPGREADIRLRNWMADNGVGLFAAADLADHPTPGDQTGAGFPAAVSFAVAMDPRIMAAIRNGPNRPYADEYARVNARIDRLSESLAEAVHGWGHRALPLAASARTDKTAVRGDFPHKTAATRAGLGWIGRHCQLITRPFGPWVRLGTVFTDLPLTPGKAVDRGFCGTCRACVEACPAGALTGTAWRPGISRGEILDVLACDRWKKTHYQRFHGGHNCGICSSACPYGRKITFPIST